MMPGPIYICSLSDLIAEWRQLDEKQLDLINTNPGAQASDEYQAIIAKRNQLACLICCRLAYTEDGER